MNTKREVTHQITVADQPTEEDLRGLKGEGYVGVINLRNDGEPEQPLDTVAEGEAVRALGMDYLHVGIGGAPLPEDGVRAVCDFLDAHADGKVLVHCRKGGRAAAMVLLHHARANNWGPDEALQNGLTMGLAPDGPLKTMVQTFIREHPSGR